jgi:hypothetical protein
MPAFNSPVEVCNMANGSLGLRNSIHDIVNPKTDKELVYSQWYDITRQYMLKILMPNFALSRRIVSAITLPAAYALDYGFGYEYPSDCLKLLGIGPVNSEDERPTVESSMILTNTEYLDGCPIRFIADITDVSKFSPDFIFTFAGVLAKCTALSTTQDPAKKASMLKDAASEFINSTAQNAQENKPIRMSHSRFRNSRYSGSGGERTKY